MHSLPRVVALLDSPQRGGTGQPKKQQQQQQQQLSRQLREGANGDTDLDEAEEFLTNVGGAAQKVAPMVRGGVALQCCYCWLLTRTPGGCGYARCRGYQV